MHQDPDRDRYTSNEEGTVTANAADELELIAVSKRWIARHGCPITFRYKTFQRKAFVGDLKKELLKRSQVAQAHSTTYHPQTKGLVERQNCTLVSMLMVSCSRYWDDWDRHLPQVMGAYNITEDSTTVISTQMVLTSQEKALPLTYFYLEYKGKKTAPQTYVRDVIRRQQELCRRNTQQAHNRQKRRFVKKDCGCESLLSRRFCLGVPGGSSTKRKQKLLKNGVVHFK